MPELDAQHRAQLAAVFRGSTRNPEHLAFLVEPLIAGWLADARAGGWDESVQAVAWCLDNGEPSAAAALAYVAENNPYRGGDDG